MILTVLLIPRIASRWLRLRRRCAQGLAVRVQRGRGRAKREDDDFGEQREAA
jgi:hypothetical protein